MIGAVMDSYEFDAYGNEITHTGTTSNNYLYRGEQYDSDLGLYYLRARYYNPLTGRFMSKDPSAGDITIPATLHKYLYAAGDPVNLSDPTGRDLVGVALQLRKVVAVATAVALVGSEVGELIDCISDFVQSLTPSSTPTISAGSKACAIKFHDEWPTEPPEGPPGPPRWPTPWEPGPEPY